MTTASTIVVFHNGDGTVSVSASIPPGVSMSGRVVERYRVYGNERLEEFPGTHQLADYETWKREREVQGFVFQAFPI